MESKKIEKIVKSRHPVHARNEKHWAFLEDTYGGDRAWFTDHIFRYHKEGDDEFKARVERSYRFNHTREIVDLVNKYLFKANISRNKDDAPESVRVFWNAATVSRGSIDRLMRLASRKASITGRTWVVVDNTATGEAPATRAEEKKAGHRIYAYVVSARDALDMSFDGEGELNWILFRERVRKDEDPFSADREVKVRYRLWTRERWFLFSAKKEGREVKYALEDQGEHNLGIVPAVPVDHVDSEEQTTAPALIDNIAYLDRAVANYLSNLDAIIQDQTFSQLAIPAQGVRGGDESDTQKKIVEMGTKRIFTYDAEGGSAPFFLSPDPKQAELIITVIKQIINEIYHSVGVAGERTKQDNAVGIDNSSGVAKAFDFERVNALLVSKARALNEAENKIARVVAAWNGIEIDEDAQLVCYADSFDVRGLMDEFQIAQNLELIQAPSIVLNEHMKGMVDKLFPHIGKELRERMREEIDRNGSVDPESIPRTSFGEPEKPVSDEEQA